MDQISVEVVMNPTHVKIPYDQSGWEYKRNKWDDWCKDHCEKSFQITLRTSGPSGTLLGIFESENDATLFTLRWS